MISRPRREAGLVCRAIYRNTDQLKHRCSLPNDHKAGFRSWHHLGDLKTEDMKSCPGAIIDSQREPWGQRKSVFR